MHQVQSTAKTTSLPSAISDEAMAVRGALLDRGLETPMVANHLSRDQRYDRIRDAFTTVMETVITMRTVTVYVMRTKFTVVLYLVLVTMCHCQLSLSHVYMLTQGMTVMETV